MSNFTLKRSEHIDAIINNFDFEKVNKVMNFLNWTWFFSTTCPTIDELKQEAKRILNEICDSEDDTIAISTGGFKASIYDDHLELEFIVALYDSELLNNGHRYEKIKKLKTRSNKLTNIEKSNNNEKENN